MVTLLDTSTLVAALVPAHPRHAWALPYLEQQGASLCTHSLAEVYAVLSGSPQFRLAPAAAARIVERLATRLTVVTLDAKAYEKAVARVSALGLGGGAIYDALIAQAALDVNAMQLVTLNAKHFVRLGEDVAERVVAPEG